MPALLIAAAGMMGACGVSLAALAAHTAPGSGLDSAAYILLFHAAAVLGGVSVVGQGLVIRGLVLAAGWGWVAGSALFSGDIAMRAFAGRRLFAMAAPTGGTMLIAAWVLLTVAAVAVLVLNRTRQ